MELRAQSSPTACDHFTRPEPVSEAIRKVLGSGEVSGCERWAPPVVGGETSPVNEPWTRPLTAAQLEALQRDAYDEAFARGREEGIEAGHREGTARALEELRPAAEQCRELLGLLSAPLDALDEEIERDLVALAFAVARQIVHRELKTAPGEVVGAVREALSVLPSSARDVRLLLHPGDTEIVREALALDGDEPGWRVVEDPGLTRGGCRIESEASRIDATVEGRLAAVIANVLGGQRDEDADE